MYETSTGAPDDVNAPLPEPRWTVQWADGPVPDQRRLRPLTGHSGPVRTVATAIVDGRPVAVSGSRDDTVRVWDLATGEQLHDPVTGRTDPVSSMTAEVLSVATAVADGRPVAFSRHGDDSVLVWDLATGRAAGEFVRLVESAVLDGRRVLLTLGADGTLSVADLLTGRRVAAFPSASGIAVLDGRRVVLTVDPVDVDRTVRVWDLATGGQLARSLAVVRTVDVEGRVLAVTAREPDQEGDREPDGEPDPAADPGEGRLWDLATSEPLDTPEAAAALSGGVARPGVTTLTVVRGRAVAVGLDGEEPRFIGPLALARQNGALVRTRARETALLDGRTVALTAEADGTLRIWDLTDDGPRVHGMRVIDAVGASGTAPTFPPGPEQEGDLWHRISGRGTSPSGSADPVLLTVEQDDTVVVRDRATGKPVGPPLTGHTGKVWDVATTVVDGRPLAVTASADHTLRTWDLSHALAHGDGPSRAGHTGTVTAVTTAVLDGSPVVVTTGADHTLRVRDLSTGRQVTAPVAGLEGEVTAMVASEVDGRPVIVTAGSGDTLHLLDPVGGEHIGEPVTSHHGRVLALAGATLAGRPVVVTAGTDRTAAIWDLATRRPVGEPLTGHTSRVTAVATAELAGRPVAVTGSWDKTVRLWDLGTGRQIGEPLTGHTDWVTSVATTLIDGRPFAVSRSRDRTVRLWDLATLRESGEPLTGHTDPNGPMVVTTGGARPVMAVGQGQAVRFWDLATGREVGNEYALPLPPAALAAAPGGLLAVAFGPELAVLRPAAG
ncbi:WD40 repeat domain-containing protein [Streptomyces sp. NRRL S-237]|uniref:WD40 repeat domain-containing protein n=1 Tax=Streptomyces sp. NRRL S-237 TaxID=1463895 RepID=UPI0004C47D46|nr:WD40 repeat domain-containing protein [Streptomyces sp. NRRL S-237]